MLKLKTFFEVLLIKIAARILIGRNVQRSAIVSRRDNNAMWYMAEKLEGICKRMSNGYEDYETRRHDGGEPGADARST